LPEERAWIDKVIEAGYIDTFRTLHPDQADAYSWWAAWGGARDRNVGWRIDYFFASPDLLPRIKDANIHPTIMGSDHCPISLTLE
jgi:exodeoxyribonuclease III